MFFMLTKMFLNTIYILSYMANYFVVIDKVSGKEQLYQVVQGSLDEGFNIVAEGRNIGNLADKLIQHVEAGRGDGFDIQITPPDCRYWLDVKPGSEFKSELDESDFVTHEMKKMRKRHIDALSADLYKKTKDLDLVFMFMGE